MTDYEKQKTEDLRLQGNGYKSIAAALGISRDTVRSYCMRNGLNGNSKVVHKNVEEKIKNNVICTHCRKPIRQRSRGRLKRFCTDFCRRKWWNENQDKLNKKSTALYKIKCLNCGEEFISYGNNRRKYCNHDCYIASRFRSEENGV